MYTAVGNSMSVLPVGKVDGTPVKAAECGVNVCSCLFVEPAVFCESPKPVTASFLRDD